MRSLMSGRVTSLIRGMGRPNDRSNWYMEIPLATAINVHSAKLTTQISQGRLLPGIFRSEFSAAPIGAFRRGRRMSSPPQFGQVPCVFEAHTGQKVHSYEQTYASPSARRTPLHFSHWAFISRCMAGLVPLDLDDAALHRHFDKTPRLSTKRKRQNRLGVGSEHVECRDSTARTAN